MLELFFIIVAVVCMTACNTIVLTQHGRDGWLLWQAAEYRKIKTLPRKRAEYLIVTICFIGIPFWLNWHELFLVMIAYTAFEWCGRLISDALFDEHFARKHKSVSKLF